MLTPPPPSFIVYIHTSGKVVILQRPSLFLTSLSVRKFISSEIGPFQLCGGNLTNIKWLESLGICAMSPSFWFSFTNRCSLSVKITFRSIYNRYELHIMKHIDRNPGSQLYAFKTHYILVLCSKHTHNFFLWERLNGDSLQTLYSSSSFLADVRLSRSPEGGITAWSKLYQQSFYLAQFYNSSAKETQTNFFWKFGKIILLRFESSTLILCKELSSTIFQLWVSQSVSEACVTPIQISTFCNI